MSSHYTCVIFLLPQSDVGRLLDEVRQRISALQLSKKIDSILRQVGRQSPQLSHTPPPGSQQEEGEQEYDSEVYTKAILPRPVLHANLREGRQLERVVGGLERQRREAVRRYTMLKTNEVRTLKTAMERSMALPLPPQRDRKRSLRTSASGGDDMSETPSASSRVSPAPPPPSPETVRRRCEVGLPVATTRWRLSSSADDEKPPEVQETPVEDAGVGGGGEPRQEQVQNEPPGGKGSSTSLSVRIEQQARSVTSVSTRSTRSSISLSPQPIVLPPMYLYPRNTLRCDRLSEQAIQDLDDSRSKRNQKGRRISYISRRRPSKMEVKSWQGSTGGMHLQGLRVF